MKAVQIQTYGGPEVLTLNSEADVPTPKDNQIRVKVHAISINPFDVILRSGVLKEMIPLKFPVTLGGDFAGTAEKSGDAVFGSAIVLSGGSGGFAQFVTVNTDRVAVKPHSIDFIHAAALPLVGSSVIQALEDHIQLKENQKILIHGGAGGIGHIAIQVAKAIGAYVATTVSSKDLDFAKQLGADVVIDYKNQQFEKILQNFDAVYDTVGGETTVKSFLVLKKGGILVSMKGPPDPTLTSQHELTSIGQNTTINSDRLSRIGVYVDTGKVKIHVDKTFPLENIKDAFTYQEQHHPRGKVVMTL